jgi:cysteine synthase
MYQGQGGSEETERNGKLRQGGAVVDATSGTTSLDVTWDDNLLVVAVTVNIDHFLSRNSNLLRATGFLACSFVDCRLFHNGVLSEGT